MHQRQRIRWVSVRCQGIKLAWQRWRWHCCATEIKFCEGTHTHTEVRSQPHTYAAPHAVSNRCDIDWFVVFWKRQRKNSWNALRFPLFLGVGSIWKPFRSPLQRLSHSCPLIQVKSTQTILNYHRVFQWCCSWNCLVRALSLISGYCSTKGAGKEEKQSYLHD